MNTGVVPVFSLHGLLTTVCYQIGDDDARYALEGSIAVTGSLVQWLRDNLGLFSDAADVEKLAASVDDNGGAYFVPASRLVRTPMASRRPRSDRRPDPVRQQGPPGPAALRPALSDPRGHRGDAGRLRRHPVDTQGGRRNGGQRPADAVPVRHPRRPRRAPVVNETTALRAAYAAGLAVGYWDSQDDIRANWAEANAGTPTCPPPNAKTSTPAGTEP